MKLHLNVQNKLIIPSLTTLIVLMLAASFYLTHMVVNQFVEDSKMMLTIANNAITKNINNSVTSYKKTIESFAHEESIRGYANAVGEEMEEALETRLIVVQMHMERLMRDNTDFVQINIANKSGNVVANSSRNTLTINVADRDYFKLALQGESNLSEPIMSKSLNTKALIVASPLKNDNGNVVGVIYGIVTAKSFSERTIGGVKIGKTGYSYLVDAKTGIMSAHADEGKILSLNMFQTQPWMREIAPNTGSVKRMTSSEGISRFVAYYNEPLSHTIIISCLNESEVDDEAHFIRNVTIALMMGTACIVAIILIFVIRAMVRDVRTTNAFAQDVAAGKLDSVLNVTRQDELGDLGDALRKMVSSLKDMIAKANEEGVKAHAEAEKAQAAMNEATKQSEQVKQAQERMLQVAVRLEEMTEQISSASTELAEQIRLSDEGASESSNRLQEAASAMNEMNSTVQEVANNASSAASASEETKGKAEDGAQIVNDCVKSIDATREATIALQEDMQELNSHAQSISQIMRVISDIADQTNLLALNAAIEAARAGEAGRGFAVVADEVRKLAEKTMNSTNDVGNVTKDIQASAAKSMTAMQDAAAKLEEATDYAKRSGDALGDIVSNVESMTDQVRAIATAAEEQSAASEEINRSITEVNNLSSQTAQAMDEASQAVNLLAKQMSDMNVLMAELRN